MKNVIWQIIDRVSGHLSQRQFENLLTQEHHSPLIKRRRAGLIISRVRMVAAMFAILTPLWIIIDVFAFNWPLWGILFAGRIFASMAFAGLALSFLKVESIDSAYKALGLMMIIPTVFYLFSHPILSMFDLGTSGAILSAGYAYLPFVMVAGLAVFPITLIEGLVFSSPLILSVLTVSMSMFGVYDWPSYIGILWLLILIAMVSTLSGMSQLHFMNALVEQSSHDGLTQAFTRRCGEEILDIQFQQANRSNIPFSIAFIDLDNFKSINDGYGHEEGDNSLRDATSALRKILRRGDVLVRWGGEEFLVLMPNTDVKGAKTAVQRLREFGLGTRPDGNPLTASIGVAEKRIENLDDWAALVELADHRMYVAKQNGKDRAVFGDTISEM